MALPVFTCVCPRWLHNCTGLLLTSTIVAAHVPLPSVALLFLPVPPSLLPPAVELLHPEAVHVAAVFSDSPTTEACWSDTQWHMGQRTGCPVVAMVPRSLIQGFSVWARDGGKEVQAVSILPGSPRAARGGGAITESETPRSDEPLALQLTGDRTGPEPGQRLQCWSRRLASVASAGAALLGQSTGLGLGNQSSRLVLCRLPARTEVSFPGLQEAEDRGVPPASASLVWPGSTF